MTNAPASLSPLSMKQIFNTWWPLAVGWLMMTIEIPLLTALIARYPEPEVNLAAWGIAFVVTLIIGSPAIMLLGTSTVLSRDQASYVTLHRYAWGVLGLLTLLHGLVAFTPLYDLVVVGLIGVPQEIVEPARLGLMIMLPWAIGVGYRRFNYGVLIRFGQPKAVTTGVLVRLTSDVVLFTLLYFLTDLSGVTMATTLFTLGIMAEMVYARLRVQPILKHELPQAQPVKEPVTLHIFLSFFIPLALTSILQMLAQPIVSAGLSRMPNALDSLAVWPVVFGLMIIFTSAGMSYTEVVVVLLDTPQSLPKLRRFTAIMCIITVALLFITTATPLAALWFKYLSALPQGLAQIATVGMWFVLPLPALRVLESWYQGILMNTKRTRGITESVVVYLVVNALVLGVGVSWVSTTGLYVGLFAMMAGEAMRCFWLWLRTRTSLQAVKVQQRKMALHTP